MVEIAGKFVLVVAGGVCLILGVCLPLVGEAGARGGFPVLGGGQMIEQTTDYNSLVPPSNPDYPWSPKWQPLCYYCAQPIRLTEPYAGHRQRIICGWEHVEPVKTEGYRKGSRWHCDPAKVRPTEEIDDPRCACCHTQTDKHGMVCSAAGKPPYRATTTDAKEDEIRGTFGWTAESSTPAQARARERARRPTAMETIGILTSLGAMLGLLIWLTGTRPPSGEGSRS